MKDFIFGTDNDLSRFFLRIALGGVMLPHGMQKLFGWFGGPGYDATLSFFQKQFMMHPYLVIALVVLETLGALALILGFFTRIAALGFAASMVSAIVLVHAQSGFFMNWYGTQQGEGYEYHLLAIGIALALVVGGSGRWSIDRLFVKKKTVLWGAPKF